MAAVEESRVRLDRMQEELDFSRKSGGYRTQADKDKAEEISRERERKSQLEDRKEFPPLPLGEEKVLSGLYQIPGVIPGSKDRSKFTAPGGKKVQAVPDPQGPYTTDRGVRFSIIDITPKGGK